MRYVNAKDVLPPSLLTELQEYLCGELIYVPKKESEKAAWGQVSGTRSQVSARNNSIIAAYENGTTIDMLMEMYCLSEASIRKIIHNNKKKKRLTLIG